MHLQPPVFAGDCLSLVNAEMSDRCLACRGDLSVTGDSISQCLVLNEDGKLPVLNKMSKLLDGPVHSKELMVKHTILLLRQFLETMKMGCRAHFEVI